MNSFAGFRIALLAAVLAGGGSLAAASRPRDSGLRINQPFASNFPEALLAEGITSGHVRVAMHIDSEGRLVDFLVLGYTRPELMREFLAGVREWEFEPPRQAGEPIATRAEVVFNFEARGSVVSLTAISSALAATRWVGEEPVSLVCRPHELDRPLSVVKAVAPFHPGPSLRPPQTVGTALLDFYVDPEGRPRMPVVVESSHAAFGGAAADAVAQWRFSAPTRRGQPMIVRVRQAFQFTDPKTQARGTD